MSRIGFRRFAVVSMAMALELGGRAESARSQVPVYLPPASATSPVAAPAPNAPVLNGPAIADPAPIYPPAVPTLPTAPPTPVETLSSQAAASPQYAPVLQLQVEPQYQAAPQYQVAPQYAAAPQTPIYGPAVPSYTLWPQNGMNYAPTPPAYTAAAPAPPMPMTAPPRPPYVPTPGYAAPFNAAPGVPPPATEGYEAFDPPNFTSGTQTAPHGKARWLQTSPMPTLPGYGPGGLDAACGPRGGCDPYNAGPPTGCDPCNASGCGCNRWYDNISVFGGFDAFKTPVDLDGQNANFGSRVGFNAALPVWAPWGIGAQVSGSAGWYDWKGTQYTGDDYRFQNFWTIGLFQRSCSTGLGFGIAYDWMYDDYWANMRFGQWRVGASWQINTCNEVGFWGALPDNRDSTTATGTYNQFQSLMQGNFYYRRVWGCAASTTVYAGLAESPSDVTFGVYHQAAMNDYLALYGGAHYVLPSSGGSQGRQEELWNLTMGIAIYPGSAMRVAQSQFRPFFTPADNGNFGIWRK